MTWTLTSYIAGDNEAIGSKCRLRGTIFVPSKTVLLISADWDDVSAYDTLAARSWGVSLLYGDFVVGVRHR